MEPCNLSVRRIVETVLRSGDIDSRYVDSSVMSDGAKAHRKLQKLAGEGYKKEVSLRAEAEISGIPCVIKGRADGVITDRYGGITIDEIKTTTMPLDKIALQYDSHAGQAKCYAHMLLEGMENPPEEITVQVTYYQLETEETDCRRAVFTRCELADFFEELLERYGVWLKLELARKELRETSARAIAFPFHSYRKGQREMAVAVYRAIERQKRLYAQAPTGIGKTLSALFPSIKAAGEGKAGKIFYLTAKTVTRTVAEDAMKLMSEKGLRFKTVSLRAKDKICFLEETACNPESCEYARGHYDRVNSALLDLLENDDVMTPDIISAYAKKHRVCPYELSLDAALWADLIICDYNYVFDPVVYLRRFFGDGAGDYVFLVDEAHNLPDRVRDMYTASLGKSAFGRLKRELKDKNPEAAALRKSMSAVDKYLLSLKKALIAEGRENLVSDKKDEELTALAARFAVCAGEWLAREQYTAHTLRDGVLELYFSAMFFAAISEIYDECYATITELSLGDVKVTLFCLDPSKITSEKLRLAKSCTLFSATLSPLPYYRELLGGAEEDGMLTLASPFDPQRLLIAVNGAISTRYADREASISPVAEAIYAAVSQKRGNYVAYFPSYEYMKKVHAYFASEHPETETLLQRGDMGEDERSAFLSHFDAENLETLVGFCVMGGAFSEGVDLKGDRLIGVIIVGVGLPGISLRQDLIRDYFTDKNGRGYDYAYVYPGMNKVMQAAGRVIRSESDYGLVLLIDSRFATSKYRALYPPWWSGMKTVRSPREIAEVTGRFPYFRGE